MCLLNFSWKTNHIFSYRMGHTKITIWRIHSSVPFSTAWILKFGGACPPQTEVTWNRSGKGISRYHNSTFFLPLFSKWSLKLGIPGSTAALRPLPTLRIRSYSEKCCLGWHVAMGWLCWKQHWFSPQWTSLESNSGGTNGLLALGAHWYGVRLEEEGTAGERGSCTLRIQEMCLSKFPCRWPWKWAWPGSHTERERDVDSKLVIE